MKKVIYSCITGGYDDVPVHKYVAPDWDYVLFTDNKELIAKGRCAHWIIRPLVFNKLTNVKNNRWHKINTHKLFPEYDVSIYLDGNIIVNNSGLFKVVEKLIADNVLIGVPNHPHRKCIYDEAKVIKKRKIDLPKIVNAEIKVLKADKYPKKNGLSENNILFRQHNKIQNTLDLWWNMVETYSKRDQLSFCYALWKTNIKYVPIYTDEQGFGIHHKKDGDFTFVHSQSHNHDPIVRTKHIPKNIGKILCLFIPIAKYRNRFKDKYIKD